MWFDSVVLAGAVSGACVRPRAPNLVPTHLRCVLARVFSVQTHLGVLPPHRGHGNVHITDVPRATVQKAVLFIRQGECPCQWSGLFGRAIIPTTYLEIKKADSTEEVFITPLKIVTFKMCFYLFWFVFFLIKVKSDLGKWWRWTISATTCLFCFKEDDVFIPKKSDGLYLSPFLWLILIFMAGSIWLFVLLGCSIWLYDCNAGLLVVKLNV